MKFRERLRAMDRSQQLMWLALIWLLLAAFLWIWWNERTLPDIRGRWASAGCEEIGGTQGSSRLKRTMEISETDRRLQIDFYGETGCTDELFSVMIEGPYDIGPKSMEMRDATTARFELGKLTLTPRTPEAVTAFNGAGCGDGDWKVGEGQDVSQFGCLGLVPTIDICPVEYDIVKIQDDMLFLGDRSRGMCATEVYPKSFATTPLVRI
jgi:hypothetical protein